MNLFKDIRENHGQKTVRSVRDLEGYGKKIAKHHKPVRKPLENQLQFG